MSPTPLQTACELLPEGVERVDTSKKGEVLVRTLEDRWYRLEDDTARPCPPHLDRDLPVAASLDPDRCEILAYRPGRRVVFRTTSRPEVVYKGYRKGRAGRSVTRFVAAGRALREGSLGLPRLLDIDHDQETLAFEHVPGEPLTVREADCDSFQSLGTGLRRLQARVDDVASLEPFTVSDELQVLTRLADKVERLAEVPERARAAIENLEALAAQLPEPRWVPSHRDLHDGQFIRSGEQLTVLDFDLFCRADDTLDVANLLCHLALRSMQASRMATERSALACGEALLEGWYAGSSDERWMRLRFYQATTFARLALVYSLRPRWRHLSEDLLTLAEKCRGESALVS